jgi:signal transduction histidine kinase
MDDAALDRLRARLTAGTSPIAVLSEILTTAVGHVGSIAAGIGRFDADRSALTLILTSDPDGGTRPVLEHREPESASHPRALSALEVDRWLASDVIIHTPEDFRRFHADALRWSRSDCAGIDRLLVVPIRKGGTLLGAFMLAISSDQPSSPTSYPQLAGLAGVAATALEGLPAGESAPLPCRFSLEALNVSLTEQVAARRRAEELAKAHNDALVKALALLTAEPDVDRFLGHTLLAIVDGLGAIGGSVWLPAEDCSGFQFHLECVDGRILTAAESSYPSTPESDSSGSRRFVMSEREINAIPAIATTDDPNLSSATRAYLVNLGVGAVQCVPMTLNEQTLGWISIRHATRVTDAPDEDRRFAESLGRLATIAVHLARASTRSRNAAVIEERSRLVREMHDTLAQQLTGLVVQLEAAKAAATGSDLKDAGAHYEQAIMLARLSLRETRRSMVALRNDPVDRQSLAAALDSLVMRARGQPGLQVFASVADDVPPWNAESQGELVRMAQEAVANALRHSKAHSLAITWGQSEAGWVLEIRDDGVGFDVGAPSDGMGLSILAERAAHLGAALAIKSLPGHGTSITVTIPSGGRPGSSAPVTLFESR